MKKRKSIWTGILSAFGMLLIILDTKTAILGAQEGVELCISSVIPALFPFFLLSALINTSLTGKQISILRPIGSLCGVPKGCESLLVLGMIGGYPVGAQAVTDAYNSKTLCKEDAQRMLGFCSNAGPSFIFGILSGFFSTASIPWVIWGVHILSIMITALLLPNKSKNVYMLNQPETLSLPRALERSIKVLATVCGWVVLFRVLIAFCQRWFLWLLSPISQTIFIGIMELTNSCCNLGSIDSEGMRFILCCCFLAMGGLCVLMQTISVTRPLGLGMYIPGKILQTFISLVLACIIERSIYPYENAASFLIPIIAAILAGCVLLICYKKSSSIMKKSVV